MAKKQKQPSWVAPVQLATAAVTLAVLALLGTGLANRYVYFSGLRPVLLAGDTVDLRDARMTVAEYEELAEKLPDSRILWSVPIGGSWFDSASEHIVLERITEADVAAFAYFPNLKSVSARDCADHMALHSLEQTLPGIAIDWRVHLAGQAWERDAKRVDLENSGLTVDTLLKELVWFHPGTTVDLGVQGFSRQDFETLKARFPHLDFTWGVELMGSTYSTAVEQLSFAGQEVDVQALVDAGQHFKQLKEMDLTGCGLTLEELYALHQAYPETFLRSEFVLHGRSFTTADQEMDLTGINMKTTDALEQAVSLMPNLRKVDMCDCGFSNEEMDALNKKYPGIQFVWIVKFSIYELRTDVQSFCASDVPALDYIAPKLTSKSLEPLKYCTELIALDLGHMRYDDLSFLENMHKLQYLILVEARYTDISVLAQMKDLVYLELFKNTLDDVTPLTELKNLKHLNIGYTDGFDYTPLKEMTWLERLWFPGHKLTDEQVSDLKAALPDTQVYMPRWDPDGSTGGKWRETDVYYEMRNLFKMFYQPGGTGTKKE